MDERKGVASKYTKNEIIATVVVVFFLIYIYKTKK
jgi:hypothetical protein